MKNFRKTIALVQILILSNAVNVVLGAALQKDVPQVLMILFHGIQSKRFNEYLETHEDSAFNKLKKNGVIADYMEPSFPTYSFPNQYTLVTGKTVENHGIVHDVIYDPNFNQRVDFNNHSKESLDNKWWNQSDPIWMTLKNKGYKTASLHWAGCDVKGRSPDIPISFDKQLTHEEKVHQVFDWISKFKIEFTTLYLDVPGSFGKINGPKSQEYFNGINESDNFLTLLINKLNESELYEKIDIIIVGDHGLADMKEDNTILLDLYVNIDSIDLDKSVFGSTAQIYPRENQTESVYKSLSFIPNLRVYYKNDIPSTEQFNFYYKNNERIAPIVVVCDEGFILQTAKQNNLGGSGFSTYLESMRTIFLAHGPSFKPGVNLNNFRNVHVYSLLCKLMNIECLENDGEIDSFASALVDGDSTNSTSPSTPTIEPSTSNSTSPSSQVTTPTIESGTTNSQPSTDNPEPEINSTLSSGTTTTTNAGICLTYKYITFISLILTYLSITIINI